MRTVLALIAAVLLHGVAPAMAEAFDGCAEHLPFGVPALAEPARTSAVCHAGYAALVDDDRLVPRWVAYHLTGAHTLGCLRRTNDFHADDQLAPDARAVPADYVGSGFDRGHHAPAEDFAWNSDRMGDSFSMANMAPQFHAFNAGIWEKGERNVRAWALERGEVIVYVGPLLADGDRKLKERVEVPGAFWKVVVDASRRTATAFVMSQDAPSGGTVTSFVKSVTEIETEAGVRLPLPQGVDRSKAISWPVDLKTWQTKHKAACAG